MSRSLIDNETLPAKDNLDADSDFVLSGQTLIAQSDQQYTNSWSSLGGIWNLSGDPLFGEGAAGFNKAFYTGKSFSDFVYEVRLRKISPNDGPIGLLVRYSEQRDEGYLLLIWPHGDYQFSRLVGQERHALLSGTPHILNRGNRWNRLKIIGQGKKLSIFINGEALGSPNDDKFSFGRLGLVIHGGPEQKAEFKILVMNSL